MTEHHDETIAGDRGITPVGGGDNARATMLKRGFGALALTAFAALIIWGTWKGDKPVSDSARKLVIRQAAAFEPIPEAPAAPATTASIGPAPVPATPAAPAPVSDQLLESARRAPVLAYNRPNSAGRPAHDSVTGSVVTDLYGFGRGEPRNDLADKLKPTPIEGVRAARLPNRNLLVTQGTSIPCVLETAMSSDVAGFVSCVVVRDVMSDSGNVVLMEKGTQVVGEYRGNVRRGSKRLFVLWTRAKTPTGVIAALASPATDALGRAGFDGDLDTHFFERFGSALLLSVVNDASSIGRQLQDSSIQINNTTGATNSAAAIAVEQSINIPPTLNKNQGELVNIFVARDVDFSSVYQLRRTETRTQILDRTLPGVLAAPAVVTK
ncbi:type IV secretion system protein VirB10 [Bradyrhizobium japonicum]|uniref:type IV secretion system protein VirB10 n=1 Tax=Bradyrhizobium japonicum TaxID=375 RepID=UPI0020A0D9C5|nr:type IV secretion system protein VirB10 [Bradyrhizobium japonicum]MCP1768678.1 type IV secretion system protein VirB10 [Bradyrhizobium japonicum]MCP1794348.1 type IV secretion system protein VirB10 [Bradyrhizobium japonicum]MCP1811382.1 type IV secretion system protein VirB10 [Bradyrhizobium japonicum]MCP1821251.1 type IV secretion system protein VirB10 [Bradyrhizobium japonicum]MCP1876287.1 type IV secretion system protein VirB10 [Bradyrhizobium japonicum]